jgi:hypothetical protein
MLQIAAQGAGKKEIHLLTVARPEFFVGRGKLALRLHIIYI